MQKTEFHPAREILDARAANLSKRQSHPRRHCISFLSSPFRLFASEAERITSVHGRYVTENSGGGKLTVVCRWLRWDGLDLSLHSLGGLSVSGRSLFVVLALERGHVIVILLVLLLVVVTAQAFHAGHATEAGTTAEFGEVDAAEVAASTAGTCGSVC